MQHGGETDPLGSGCGPPFNAVLACNADRMCQQIKPNETHLCPSLERQDAVIAPADPGLLENERRRRGALRATRSREGSSSPSLHLTLEVMASDETLNSLMC